MTNPTLIDGEVGKIAVHDLGGEGPDTLIVAHATGFLGMVYRALAHELRSDVHVIAVDMRAHGDSDAPSAAEDFSWKGMADDLKRAIEHMNPGRLHGFGHSKGGAALLEVERTQPGTFTTAMVFEPVVPPGLFPNGSPLQKAAAGRLRTFPSRGHALERYAARPPLGLFRADVLYDYTQHGFRETESGEIVLKCTPENEAMTFSQAGTVPLASLAEIELEILVGRSGDDGFPAQMAQSVADTLPNGRIIDFPTITHFGPLQDPVIVANALRQMVTQ